jgi:hypothetical protein
MVDQPTAEDALKKLEPLLGEWVLQASSPDGEPWPGEARASSDFAANGPIAPENALVVDRNGSR